MVVNDPCRHLPQRLCVLWDPVKLLFWAFFNSPREPPGAAPEFGCSLLWAVSPFSLDILAYFPNMHIKLNVLVCCRKDDHCIHGAASLLVDQALSLLVGRGR